MFVKYLKYKKGTSVYISASCFVKNHILYYPVDYLYDVRNIELIYKFTSFGISLYENVKIIAIIDIEKLPRETYVYCICKVINEKNKQVHVVKLNIPVNRVTEWFNVEI
jgi:hypothetical protein